MESRFEGGRYDKKGFNDGIFLLIFHIQTPIIILYG